MTAFRPGLRSADLLGQCDDDARGAAEVAEPEGALVLRHLAEEFRAVDAKAGDGVVDVVDGEHDTVQAQRAGRRILRLSGRRRRGMVLTQLQLAVAVGSPHHRDLALDAVETDGAVRPHAFDLPLAFQLHAELSEERDRCVQVLYDDPDVIHPLNSHVLEPRTAVCLLRVQLGEQVGGLSCTDPLEYLQRLPQQLLRLRSLASGQRAAAQSGQCVRLVPGTGHVAGQFQGLLVAFLCQCELTVDPVQRSPLIAYLGRTTPVAHVVIDGKRLVQGQSRVRVITHQSQRAPQVTKGVGLAVPVTKTPVDAESFLQSPHRGRVIARLPQYISQVAQPVGQAEPVTKVAGDAQCLLHRLGRPRIVARQAPRARQIKERIGLAEPVIKIAVDAERLLQGIRRGWVVTRNLTALTAPLPIQNGLWSRPSGIQAEEPCSAEENWSFLTLFIALSTDPPPNGTLRSHTRSHSPMRAPAAWPAPAGSTACAKGAPPSAGADGKLSFSGACQRSVTSRWVPTLADEMTAPSVASSVTPIVISISSGRRAAFWKLSTTWVAAAATGASASRSVFCAVFSPPPHPTGLLPSARTGATTTDVPSSSMNSMASGTILPRKD